MPIRVTMFPPKYILSNKTLSGRHGKPPIELLVGEVKETSKTIQSIAIALVSFREVLQKIPQTLNTGL